MDGWKIGQSRYGHSLCSESGQELTEPAEMGHAQGPKFVVLVLGGTSSQHSDQLSNALTAMLPIPTKLPIPSELPLPTELPPHWQHVAGEQ